jgi:exosortase
VTLTARDTSGLRGRSFWPPRLGTAISSWFTVQLLVVLIPILAIGWVYGSTVASLVRQWTTDDDYSHGFFVVPLAVFFAWERRHRIRALPLRPTSAGALVLCASLFCFVAGQFGSELFLSRVSLIGVLAGLVLWLGGWQYLGALAFPLGFLLLMVPLPEIIFSRITFPLQMLASRLGEAAIAASGIPVLREGNILQLPGRALEVVEACSGIRSLMTLVMLGIVLGYFSERRTSVRVMLAIAAIPIAVFANAIRVAGTGLISYWVSPAAADGFFHSFSGWIVFVVALIGLLAFQRVLGLARGRWSATADASC